MKVLKFGSIMFVTLLLIGCFGSREHYDKETVIKVEEMVESYLKNNYKDIESVEIEKVYSGPMGGLNVDGTVNNKYMFNLDVEESDFSIGSMAVGKGFPDFKDECKEKSCPY